MTGIRNDNDNEKLAKKTVDSVEDIIGEFPGNRRAHARGEVCQAVFTPNGKAAGYTTAEHLREKEVQAVVRFSHSSPDPTMPDSFSPIKGMAVKFLLPDGKESNIVGATVPVFVTKKPEAFLDMLQIGRSMKKGRPRLIDMIKLFRKYPESKTVLKLYRKIEAPASFAEGHYYGIHAFFLVNEAGERQPVKFIWEPAAKELKEKKHGNSRLEDELDERLFNGSVEFNLIIQIGNKNDPTDDPTVEWPKERKTINIGRLSILNKLVREEEDFVFDPTITGEGIECSADEILHFRKQVYGVSHSRRRIQK